MKDDGENYNHYNLKSLTLNSSSIQESHCAVARLGHDMFVASLPQIKMLVRAQGAQVQRRSMNLIGTE
jgi:hypothetical protein